MYKQRNFCLNPHITYGDMKENVSGRFFSEHSVEALFQSVSPPSAYGKNFLLCCSSNLESYICIPADIEVSSSLDFFKRHLKTHYFTSP